MSSCLSRVHSRVLFQLNRAGISEVRVWERRGLHCLPSTPRIRLRSQQFRIPPSKRLYNATLGAGAAYNSPAYRRSLNFLGRVIRACLFTASLFSLGFLVAMPAEVRKELLKPRDEDTEHYEPPDAESAKIDQFIQDHPIVVRLRADSNYTESRPHLSVPEAQRRRNFTAGTLAGPGKLVVPPYIFSENSGKDMTSISYLGEDVCGYPGVVHGGLLATMLDEGLARCCFPALPNKIGMTANLNINYRIPAPASKYYVLKAKTVKVEGRKAWVEGHIESLAEEGEEPAIHVEATALFIEPRNAETLRKVFPIKGENSEEKTRDP